MDGHSSTAPRQSGSGLKSAFSDFLGNLSTSDLSISRQALGNSRCLKRQCRCSSFHNLICNIIRHFACVLTPFVAPPNLCRSQQGVTRPPIASCRRDETGSARWCAVKDAGLPGHAGDDHHGSDFRDADIGGAWYQHRPRPADRHTPSSPVSAKQQTGAVIRTPKSSRRHLRGLV